MDIGDLALIDFTKVIEDQAKEIRRLSEKLDRLSQTVVQMETAAPVFPNDGIIDDRSDSNYERTQLDFATELRKQFLVSSRTSGIAAYEIAAGDIYVGVTKYHQSEWLINATAAATHFWYAIDTSSEGTPTITQMSGTEFPADDPGTDGVYNRPICHFTVNAEAGKEWAVDIFQDSTGPIVVGGTGTTIVLKWTDGETLIDDRPYTEPGMYWHVDRIETHSSETWIIMDQECLSAYGIAGYRKTNSNVVFTTSDGSTLPISTANGLLQGITEDTILGGISTLDGAEISITAHADGTVSGYEGTFSSFNELTGAAEYYRIESDGTIRY